MRFVLVNVNSRKIADPYNLPMSWSCREAFPTQPATFILSHYLHMQSRMEINFDGFTFSEDEHLAIYYIE